MGDALETYFEGRASLRTESPSLESGGITRAGMSIAKTCYDTLRKYGKAAIIACENNVVTPAQDAIIEATVYLSGVGADNVNCAAPHSFYNGVTSLGGHGDFTEEDLHTIAKNACVKGETIHNLAGDVTPDELYAAIIATDALGKARLGK